MSVWDGAIFLLASSLLLGLSLRGARRCETFLVADRAVGFWALVATLVMTEFNPATLLAFAAAGYRVGPRAVGLSAVFLIGLGWYTLTVARKWKQYNGVSVAGWFSQRYGVGFGRTAAVLLLTAMLGFSATYVKSLTLIVTPLVGDASSWIVSAVLCFTLAVVAMSGGLASVIRLDIIGFLLAIVLFPTLLIVAITRHGGTLAWEQAFAGRPYSLAYWARWDDPQLPWSFVLSLVVLTCLTYICSPWYGQKIFAAQNERTAVSAVAVSSILVFLLYASVQLSASLLPADVPDLANPHLAVPSMIQHWLPPGGRGLAYAVLFAVATTTLAGVWSAMVGMLVSDFSGAGQQHLSVQRGLTLVVATLSWLGANLVVEDILARLILANIPIAALAFALLGGFHWQRTSRVGAWASVVVGTTWGLFCFLYWGEAGGYTWYWTIYGSGLIFGVGIVTSLWFPDHCPQT